MIEWDGETRRDPDPNKLGDIVDDLRLRIAQKQHNQLLVKIALWTGLICLVGWTVLKVIE